MSKVLTLIFVSWESSVVLGDLIIGFATSSRSSLHLNIGKVDWVNAQEKETVVISVTEGGNAP